ncbi:hypothetical protein Q1695_013135 [Nippostrongylus brasiliensis]|nr:hypothetical protein Q1695_013135 [Nippostrongylus brasiliensis]
MRPFLEGDGYWLSIPKPWKRKQAPPDSKSREEKRLKLERTIESLMATKKRRRKSRTQVSYKEGQSLFVLPKALSKGIRHWKNYEVRFREWTKRNASRSNPIDDDSYLGSDYENENSNIDMSILSQSCEDDPVRGFYTIWHTNTKKVAKSKLSTPDKVVEYVESVWESTQVERSLSKPPKGAVCGRINDAASLSARARDVLQRWSRVVSRVPAGDDSGEDEDPVEMWNRAVEVSGRDSSLEDSSLIPSTCSEKSARLTRKKKRDESETPSGPTPKRTTCLCGLKLLKGCHLFVEGGRYAQKLRLRSY